MSAQKSDEVALITGSRRGIGLGVALALAENGFNIAMNGVSDIEASQEALALVRETGVDSIYIQADISRQDEREKLISGVKSRFGRLDLLVNNAGVAPNPREDMLLASEASFDRLMGINLKGPYFLTQLGANWMIKQKQDDSSRNPKIINITSINAAAASPARGDYCVSKAGLSMVSSLYAARLAEFGICVFEIRPGMTKTDIIAPVEVQYTRLIEEGLVPMKRWGTPSDIGKAVLAIALELFPFSTGEVINVDGGLMLSRF